MDLGVSYGLALWLKMILGSVNGPTIVLENGKGTTVQTIINSTVWMDKLLRAQRNVERYSELTKKLICALFPTHDEVDMCNR